jgi:hypothetical protein
LSISGRNAFHFRRNNPSGARKPNKPNGSRPSIGGVVTAG